MGCIPCGGGDITPTRYELELPDGTKLTYLSEVEARIAATQHGGGVITTITT